MNGSSTSGGKPFGKVGSGRGEMRAGKLPVADRRILPAGRFREPGERADRSCAPGPAGDAVQAEKAQPIEVGRSKYGLCDTAPSVSLPSSPKSAASGASPTPKLSSTMRKIRLTGCISVPPDHKPRQSPGFLMFSVYRKTQALSILLCKIKNRQNEKSSVQGIFQTKLALNFKEC